MKSSIVKCPNCGASIQVGSGARKYSCSYCDTEVCLDNDAASSDNVKTQNSEFDLKLTLAQNMEQIFFISGPKAVQKDGQSGYNAVIDYYSDVEVIGGTRYEYWLSLSRFYVKGNLHGFHNGSIKLLDRQKFIGIYTLFIDNAIKFCNTDRFALEEEKRKTIEMLSRELMKIHEHKQGCYIATAVYHSYSCPQVWVLRRFRDQCLAKAWAGRAFIKIYYTVSPTLVKLFGKTKPFKTICKGLLDKIVSHLEQKGLKNTRYEDKN